MRIRTVFVVALLTALVSLVSSSNLALASASRSSLEVDRTVRMLFEPVEGLRRVGGAFPVLGAVGRRGVYRVTRDPLETFDRFVAHARALGFSLAGSGWSLPNSFGTCVVRMADGVEVPLTSLSEAVGSEALTCASGAVGTLGSRSYNLGVGMDWDRGARHLIVSLSPSLAAEEPSSAELSPTPSIRDLPRPRAPSRPKGGVPVGPKFNAFSDGEYRRLRLEEGTTVAMAPTDPRYVLVALRVATDADCGAMIRAYAQQLGDAEQGRSEILAAGSVPSAYAEPLGGGGAFLGCDQSGRHLLITGGSD